MAQVSMQITFFAKDGKSVLWAGEAHGPAGKQQEFAVRTAVDELPADARCIMRTSDGLQATLSSVAGGVKEDKVWARAGKQGDPFIVQLLFKKQASGLWKMKKVVATCATAMPKLQPQPARPRVTCEDEENANEMLACARFGEKEDMEELLNLGTIPVDFQNEGGTTALHYASANGNVDCMQPLLQRGAKVLQNNSGNTALHWAVQNKQLEAVRALVAGAADLDVLVKNSFGKSALTEALAEDQTEIADLILGHGSAAALEPEGGGGGAGAGEGGGGGGVVEEEVDEEVGEEGEGDGLEDGSGDAVMGESTAGAGAGEAAAAMQE